LESGKNKFAAVVFLLWLGIGCVFVLFGKPKEISYSERRKLVTAPQLTLEGVLSGKFGEQRETYLADQFPGRELLRRGKALADFYVLNKQDVHGVYVSCGQAAELIYPLRGSAVSYAGEKLRSVAEKYLAGTDCNVYYAIIPDKGYYLAEENGYPHADYTQMEELFAAGLGSGQTDWIERIRLWDKLGIEDYYRTDLHWRQERIADVAGLLAESMGSVAYSAHELEWQDIGDFYGVYYGQTALPLKPDRLCFGSNEEIAGCVVHHPVTGEESAVYPIEKSEGLDRYDLFLSGAEPLLVIKKASGETGRRLVIFRDSFTSSLAPYFIKGYDEITLIDLRYMHSDLLADYVEFTDQDVLFLYYTGLLNNGYTLK